MTGRPESPRRKFGESLISGVSAGSFFIILGAIFIATPNLFDRIINFFSNITVVSLPNTSNIFLPAPASPGQHVVVYSAAIRFSIVWAILQVFILILRFAFRSPLNKKAESVSDIIFWIGAFYLSNTYLNAQTTLPVWFMFWAGILILIGFSLVIRSIILFSRNIFSPRENPLR